MSVAGARLPQPAKPWLFPGIALALAAWLVAWLGPDPIAWYTFFPLWLGYILTVDALAYRRGGTSLLARNPRRFALLFMISIPLWWVFEFANIFLDNWIYHLPVDYSRLQYAALASLAFSTVMPAVFVTAELWRTVLPREMPGPVIAPSRGGLVSIATLGAAMFVGSLALPNVLFPLVWIGLFLLVDPVNALTGGRSIAAQVASGRWDTVLVLFAAGLTCGVFWEMWNVRSMPKWTYDVPFVGWAPIFEMPVLGYGGYLPFALEIYAFYHLAHTAIFRSADTFLTFDRDPDPPATP